MAPDEHRILNQAIAGDRKAFARLIVHYESDLRAVVRRYAETHGDVDEERLLEEIMKALFRIISTYREEESPFNAWLKDTAGRICDPWDRLLERAKAGDREALGTLLMHYRSSIHTVARKFLRKMEGFEADDVFHEVALRAQEHIAGFESNAAAFKGWLCVTAKNFCREVIRKLHPHIGEVQISMIAIEDFVERILHHDPDPAEHIVAQEEENCAKWAYNSLSEKYRIVLSARYREDKKYKQIAAELEVPIGTVSKRLYSAMRQFKEKFRHCEEQGVAS